jgi:hypothetical protein
LSAVIDNPQARILLKLLWGMSDREAGVAIVDLAEAQRDETILSACHGEGLIEFIRRNHIHVGAGQNRKLVLENGWNVGELYKTGRRPVWSLVREAVAENVDREIRYRVRLTNRGRDIAAALEAAANASVAISDLDSLNNAMSAFTKLEIAIQIVGTDLADIQRDNRDYQLSFDRQGKFLGQTSRYSAEGCLLANHDYCFGTKSSCEWLPKRIQSLWEAHAEAEAALNNLSRRLCNRLDALTGAPWIATVRRKCLDNVLKWPGDPNYQTSLAAVKVYGSVGDLLANAEKFDPHATWSAYRGLLKEYGHDLFAIRDVIRQQPEVQSFPPTQPFSNEWSASTEIASPEQLPTANENISATAGQTPERFEAAYRSFELRNKGQDAS